MEMELYFDLETGCLVGINLSREPADNEIVVTYKGTWPPIGYTYKYDPNTGTVALVPDEECPGTTGTTGDSGLYSGEEEGHAVAAVWLNETRKLSSRGAFGVPFDSYEDKAGLLLGLNKGVPIVGPGVYHVWGTVTYAILRRFGIISRDLVLTVNGKEFARYSISIYTRAQFTQNVGPVRLVLEEEKNAIGLISEPTIWVIDPDKTVTTYPVALVGSPKYTCLWIEKIGD